MKSAKLPASPISRMVLLALVIILAAGAVALAKPDIARVTSLIEYGYAWVCARSLPMAFIQFREAAAQDSANAESRVMLGIINHINGDDRQALEQWAQAESLGDMAAAALAADVLYTNGQLDEAEAAYQRTLIADPEAVKALYGLALIAEKKGKDNEAIDNLNKVVASFNKDPYYELPQAYYHLGKLQLAANNTAAALEALERGALLAPHDADMNLVLAQAYEAKGDIPEALHAFEHTLQLSPKLAPALEGLKRLKAKTSTP